MVFRKTTDKYGNWLCTDTRRWPLMHWNTEEFVNEPFSHYTRQAIIRVETGWDVSVIWGSCTYSDNYHWPFGDPYTKEKNDTFHEEPALVEVALHHPHREHVQGGDVLGWVGEEEFARFMDRVGELPSDWDGDIHELNGCAAADEPTNQGEVGR